MGRWPVTFKNCNGLLVSSSRWSLVSIIRLSSLLPRKFGIHEGRHNGKDAEDGYRGGYVTSKQRFEQAGVTEKVIEDADCKHLMRIVGIYCRDGGEGSQR